MKLHRFYVDQLEFSQSMWIEDEHMLHQWLRVLRFKEGRELALFNDRKEVSLYRIEQIKKNAVHLKLTTKMKPNLPVRELYLCFSLLKKDKNDWVLQKGTELGVSHFVPALCDRTEKTGFDIDRATKIVIEAAEQCGRADIPRIREPLKPKTIIDELQADDVAVYVAEQGGSQVSNMNYQTPKPIAALIGPEGGWSDKEKQVFAENDIQHISISDFTLRAETAAITAAALLQ